MQSDEDKKNLFDVSLTDNIKISFEQSSCPYENYACKIRDELLKQIEEDIRKIDEIKDEPCHSSEEVSDDDGARVEGGVPSITVANTGSGGGNGVIDPKQIYVLDAKVPVPSFLVDHCYCKLPLIDKCRLSLENIKQETFDSSSQDYPTQMVEDVIKQENIDSSSQDYPTQRLEDVIKQENIDLSSQDYPTQRLEDVIKLENIDSSSQDYPTQRLVEDVIKQENIDSSSHDYPTQRIEDVADIPTEDIKEEPSYSRPTKGIDYKFSDTCFECTERKIEDIKGGYLLQRVETSLSTEGDTAVEQLHQAVCKQKINTEKNIKSEAGSYELPKRSNVDGISVSEKPFTCNRCPFTTARKSSFVRHLDTHKSGKLLSCKFCSYKSYHNKGLKLHLRTHTSEKSFSCDICAYTTKRKVYIIQHLKTHTGDKPYYCDICSFKCLRKSNLQEHLRTHTGEKPYSCNVCSYKSMWKQDLKRHLSTHTGEKPLSCDICSYRCARKCHLKLHLRTHSKKPLVCNICSLKCNNEWILKLHSRKHKD